MSNIFKKLINVAEKFHNIGVLSMSLRQYMASFPSILKEWDKDKSGHRDKDPLNSSKRQIMTKLTYKTMLHLHALFVKNCLKWIGSINALRPLQLRVPNPLHELYI